MRSGFLFHDLERLKDGFNLRSSEYFFSQICYVIYISNPLNRYVYDIVIPRGIDPTPFTPQPLDGEVESFEVCQKPLHLSLFFECDGPVRLTRPTLETTSFRII